MATDWTHKDEKNRKLLEKFTIVSKLLLSEQLRKFPSAAAKGVFVAIHDARIAEFKKLL
jgi:hypothetical protein